MSKISDLNAITNTELAPSDLLVVVDISEPDTNKKLPVSEVDARYATKNTESIASTAATTASSAVSQAAAAQEAADDAQSTADGAVASIATQATQIQRLQQAVRVDEIANITLAVSVASNAMTIALKDSLGADHSSSSKGSIGFRSATANNGALSVSSIESALSITIPSGATLGHVDTDSRYIYVYAINNSGTIELAVSSTLFQDNSIVSTTVLNSSSDSITGLYSANARTNVPMRRVGRLKSAQTTAGNWATNVSEIKIGRDVSVLRHVACILRYESGAWSVLDASNHMPLNVASVETQEYAIKLNFNFTANNTLFFGVVPDEKYAEMGIFVGSGVYLSYALINFSKVATVASGYVFYNGSSWQVVGATGDLAVASFTSGQLRLTHQSCDSTNSFDIQVTGRDGFYNLGIQNVEQTYTEINFHSTIGGAAVTTPSTNMKFFFRRSTTGFGIRPMKSSEMEVAFANFWVHGLFEE